MRHQHFATEPTIWLATEEDYSAQQNKCECGEIIYRETTPLGTLPNWFNWTTKREEIRA